jgi:hypothetical protein
MLISSFQLQAEHSFMTFEGQQIQGAPKILEKLQVTIGTYCGNWCRRLKKCFIFIF